MAKFIAATLVLIFSIFSQDARAAETRTYMETVTVKVADEESAALNEAKARVCEQAFRAYLRERYPELNSPPNLAGNEAFIQDLDIIESRSEGVFHKQLVVKARVTINEEEVRAYLKRQGAAPGKNDDRRIVVMLIPGKMDSGDAPLVLDYLRAEVRKSLAAAKYTVIDSDDQAVQNTLNEEADYNHLVAHLNRIADQLADKGEWLILGKVDMDAAPSGGELLYRATLTGKAVSLANRSLLWEGNLEGAARAPRSEAKTALRLAAIDGGKAFAREVLGALNGEVLTQEKMGSRYEFIVNAKGDFRLESKFLKAFKGDLLGVKSVSTKTRGKKGSAMVVDVFYQGKIDDLLETLIARFESDPDLKRFNPEKEGNKVIFRPDQR